MKDIRLGLDDLAQLRELQEGPAAIVERLVMKRDKNGEKMRVGA